VGQHKNYISAGKKKDEVGAAYFNLLLEKRVDLIVQAHDHTYQRSRQLRLGPSCAALLPGRADMGCVSRQTNPDAYSAGDGSVLVINGSGGRQLYDVNLSDPEAPYFTKIAGRNNGGSFGYLKLTITKKNLAGSYIVSVGEKIRDDFTIAAGP
jgi:hypothetical protein